MQTSGLQKSQQKHVVCMEGWYGERLYSERPLPGLAGLELELSAESLGPGLSPPICPGLGRQCRDQLSSHQLHLSGSFSALSLKPSWPSPQQSCVHFPFGARRMISLPLCGPPWGKASSTRGFACGRVLQHSSNAEPATGLHLLSPSREHHLSSTTQDHLVAC